MAWLERKDDGPYHLGFRFAGERYKPSLETTDKEAAKSRRQRLEENIRLIKSGRLTLPNDADVSDFLLSDGTRVDCGIDYAASGEFGCCLAIGVATGTRFCSLLLTAKHFELVGDNNHLFRVTPSCSHDSTFKRPAMRTGEPFPKYSAATSAVRPQSVTGMKSTGSTRSPA